MATSVDDEIESLFETTKALHGHKCPASAMGLRAGLAAREALGVEADSNEELRAYVDSGPKHPAHCFVDGVQIGTGCTYGKGNIEKRNVAKNALTLVDTETERQVRVSMDPEWFGHALDNSPFIAERKNGIEPMDIDSEVTDDAVETVLTMPDGRTPRRSATVEDIELDADTGHGTFYWEHCAECGEVTFEPGLRVVDGEHVCADCAGF
ncbi:MAG: FmdE family protein [Halodesulfurarchaeum sp.]|nr:FmdE family protein [Halodesulfurarchaeum sp.]